MSSFLSSHPSPLLILPFLLFPHPPTPPPPLPHLPTPSLLQFSHCGLVQEKGRVRSVWCLFCPLIPTLHSGFRVFDVFDVFDVPHVLFHLWHRFHSADYRCDTCILVKCVCCHVCICRAIHVRVGWHVWVGVYASWWLRTMPLNYSIT